MCALTPIQRVRAGGTRTGIPILALVPLPDLQRGKGIAQCSQSFQNWQMRFRVEAQSLVKQRRGPDDGLFAEDLDQA